MNKVSFWSKVEDFFRNLFMSRPPATTFREGQRALMVKLMCASGIFSGLLAIGLLLVVWQGAWPDDLASKRLDILGWGLAGSFAGMMIVQLALTVGGPIGKTKFSIGKDGVTAEAEDDEEDAK